MPPRIERHFASGSARPQTFALADPRTLSDIGGGLAPAALAQVGGALTDVSEIVAKWYEREGNSQYDTARGQSQRLVGEFERTTYPNADALDAGFKKLKSNIAKLPLSNRSGSRKFKAWQGLQGAAWTKISAEKKIRMINQQNQSALFNNLTNVARDYKDEGQATARINTLVQGGLDDGSIKTASQALALKEKMTENWQRVDIWRKATSIVRPDGEIDWSETVRWFSQEKNIKDLPEDIIEDFAGTARSQESHQRAEDKRALENIRKTDRQKILDKFIAEDFVKMPLFINSTSLSPEEKFGWIEKSNTRSAAINDGKNDPMNQTDPAKYFELRRNIETRPGSVTEADLAAVVGNGISIDNYKELLKIITDKGDPRNAPSAKRGQAVISRLREQSLALAKKDEDIDPREIELNALAVQNEFDQWLLANPEATDEQKEAKIRTLTQPAREAVTLNWFEKLFSPKEEGFFTAIGFNTEALELVQEKIDVLKDEDVWKTLNDEEKESARKRFEKGQTVEEIMRLLE